MSNTEKVIIVASLIFSWGLGFFLYFVFKNDFELMASAFWFLFLVIIWLIPFVLLVLFSKNTTFPLIAFLVGSLSFLLAINNIYGGLGIILLNLGFISWFFQARDYKNHLKDFITRSFLKGMGSFLTILAVFGSLLYFYSPFLPENDIELKIPQKLFDMFYEPMSDIVLSQSEDLIKEKISNTELPGNISPEDINSNVGDGFEIISEMAPSEQVKSEVYEKSNEILLKSTEKYRPYTAFFLAVASFLFLRTIFSYAKYLLVFIVFILIKFFIKARWLKKENKEITVEIIEF